MQFLRLVNYKFRIGHKQPVRAKIKSKRKKEEIITCLYNRNKIIYDKKLRNQSKSRYAVA